MTQSQIDAMTNDFIDNEDEPAHFRAMAALFASPWYSEPGSHRNISTAAELFRQGLDI